jgi:hypothetical protein
MKITSQISRKKLFGLTTGILVSLASSGINISPAQATNNLTFIGLKPNNTLVRFSLDRSSSSGVKVLGGVRISGIDGNLQGIDFRPANGLLYGVTDADKIYTIDPKTGVAKLVNPLSPSFDGGFQSGFDFNPALDRLRLVGSNDQNFSVNVDTGAATSQTTLAYVAGDRNFGKDPNLTAAAYTNNRVGATSTQLYDIDYDLDVLVLQDPPNGTLTTVGSLGVNFAPIAGMDIVTDASGRNTAFAISGSTLYNINLNKGNARKLGTLNPGFIGLAVTSKPVLP